jgi:hypothetical protein
VLFDLCRTLDLQLLVAAPEVARADGNTTYRLVRHTTADGREEVIVSGRRSVPVESLASDDKGESLALEAAALVTANDDKSASLALKGAEPFPANEYAHSDVEPLHLASPIDDNQEKSHA